MKKNILSVIFTIITCFICVNNVDALQCLYESKDGERIVLDQYYTTLGKKDYKATVYALDKLKVGNYTREAGWFVMDVYNEYDWVNEWTKIKKCPKYLKYDAAMSKTFDKVYAPDENNECKDGDKKFSYVGTLKGESPDNVGLNEMVCTYEHMNESGDTNTYTFIINTKKDSLDYALYKNYDKLYDNNLKLKDGINTGYKNSVKSSDEVYFDSFQARVFFNEVTSSYKCPDEIAVTSECDTRTNIYVDGPDIDSKCTYHIGYNEKELSKEELEKLNNAQKNGGFLWSQAHSQNFKIYNLQTNASYIDYDTSFSDNNICSYTEPDATCDPRIEDCSPLIKLSLIERKFNNGTTKIISVLNNAYQTEVTTQVNTNLSIDLSSCDNAPDLYTNCFTNSKNCTVSDQKFENSERLVVNDWSNTQNSSSVDKGLSEYNGYKYRKLLCQLSDELSLYVPESVLDTLPQLYIYSPNISQKIYKINKLDCNNWGIVTGLKCDNQECKEETRYDVELTVMELKNYCNDVYLRYVNDTSALDRNERKEECLKFNMLYNDMVEKGLIQDLTAGCDILSTDIQEKLGWILNLLKVAGPILALGLGTLDFIKAVASGDADKEMKTAFKRFSTRIAAAALLFVIPLILAFLMDTFLGNQAGYNEDNPFCNIVEWK